ncbi:MAG: SIMPL domain-containing protein [candidate division SR1 bacterium]|nr:SIMPL domain-containing protein [candidate division SR1 bacterium]
MSKQSTNGFFLLGAALILALTTFFVGNAMIQSNKNNQQTSQGVTNTISVMGEGKASVAPDMLVINVSISELATTTELAQSQANDKVSKLKDILKTADIADKDIKTTNVNAYPEYDRNQTGRKLLGYRAQQSIAINVIGDKFAEKGGNIVTQISKIGGVNVDNTYFDLKDKNTAYAGAREKAFADAKAKAEQLAKAGGVTLGKPVMITDNSYSNVPGPIYYAKGMGAMATPDAAVSNTLSPGETEVTININIMYQIK